MKLDDAGRTVIFIVGVVALVCVSAGAIAGPYEDCILQNMKGVQAQAAAGAIMRACKEKTTPHRCRDSILRPTLTPSWGVTETDPSTGKPKWVPFNYVSEGQFAADQKECLSSCADANYWSRTFGECKTD
jgi:hypothetical protein